MKSKVNMINGFEHVTYSYDRFHVYGLCEVIFNTRFTIKQWKLAEMNNTYPVVLRKSNGDMMKMY